MLEFHFILRIFAHFRRIWTRSSNQPKKSIWICFLDSPCSPSSPGYIDNLQKTVALKLLFLFHLLSFITEYVNKNVNKIIDHTYFQIPHVLQIPKIACNSL